MKISWGIKIALLYAGFVLLIGTMVVASTHQHFDLVSDSYYEDEIGYGKVIDASRNQSGLSQPIAIYTNKSTVIFRLPAELNWKAVSGSIYFYSAVHATWDKHMPIYAINNSISIPRSKLEKTIYTVKVNLEVSGKRYYQESVLDLSK